MSRVFGFGDADWMDAGNADFARIFNAGEQGIVPR
jgi:hypothetical protein